MTHPSHGLAGGPAELRQSNLQHFRGWTHLVKPPAPATGGGFTRAVPGDYFERLISLAFQLSTSAVAGTRTLSVNYTDGDGFIFNLVPLSNEIGPSQTITAYGDLSGVTPVQVPESHQAEGSVTSPALDTTLATVTLPSGGWTLQWQVQLAGTLAAADRNNIGLYQADALLLAAINGIVVDQIYPQEPVQVQVPVGGATFNIETIAVGTVGSVYSAQLLAIPANVSQLQVQLPDFLLRSGWQHVIALGGAQAGDAITGLGLLLERYPSDLASGPRPVGPDHWLHAAIAEYLG